MARVPIAGCQLSPLFRVAQGKRQSLAERKGRGGKFGSLVPPGWPGTGHLGLVYTGSNAFSLETGSGVPDPELLPGVDILSGGHVPKTCSSPFYLGHFQKIAALSSSLPWTSVDSDCHVQHDVAALLCVNTCGDRCMPSGQKSQSSMLLFFNVGGCPGIIPGLSAEEHSSRSPGREELALASFRGLHPDIPASAKPPGLCRRHFGLEGG